MWQIERVTIGHASAKSLTDDDLELLDSAPNEVLDTLEELEEALVARARVDPAAFNAYVLRDEETGEPIFVQPMQQEWQDLVTANKRVLIWSHIESGKTSSLSIGRVLYELSRNPNLRVAIISNTDAQGQKICTTIARYIEQSPELHRVAPHLKRDPTRTWTGHEIFVVRDSNAKDPSVRTLGVHGNILSARVDLLIIDDILDYENTLTANQRNTLYNWFRSTVEGRLTRNARVLCVGTAWHKDDIMHRWAARPEWVAVRYSVIEDGVITWPDRWPLERIEQAKSILGPVEFARSLLCLARTDDESRFKEAWIQTCLDLGEGRPRTHALDFVPPGFRVYTGVDLGVRDRDGSDLTVLFTILVHPENELREVLEIQSGRWNGPDIVDRIHDVHRRYHSIVMVESNAAQQFILDFSKDRSAVPVIPFNTGANKNNPEFGLESLATEMSLQKWLIPARGGVAVDPEIVKWITEMLYYDPKAHTGDRLMASWFAREAARVKKPVGRFGRLSLVNR